MRVKLSSWSLFKLWLKTLVSNSSFSFNYAMDTFAEPVFWFVDHFTRTLGRMFVLMVSCLIASIVVFAYLIGLPIYYARSPLFAAILIIVGNWILLNIIFHYGQAVRTSPGLPMDTTHLLVGTTVTICKKCIHPKPPRTHHCSICNQCYLKMDHHCPWMNNCIGHFNHRYFFLSLVYIVLGCFFVMLFGVDIAFRQVVQGIDVLPFVAQPTQEPPTILDGMEDSLGGSGGSFLFPLPSFVLIPLTKFFLPATGNEKAELLFGILVSRSQLLIIVYFVASLCIGTAFALGGLMTWHAKLITRGETSIEYHINKNGRLKLGKDYINPYDLGWRRNWQIFLGLDQRSRTTFLRHVLFPSSHLPSGNGYNWSHLSKVHQNNYCYDVKSM